MISSKEIEAVTRLKPEERYKYAIKRIADYQLIWVLGDEGGFRTYGDDKGTILFPIWPFKEYALLCQAGEFSDTSPESIELDLFLKEYLPDFKESNYKLVVFPLPSDKGVLLELDAFQNDLEIELGNY